MSSGAPTSSISWSESELLGRMPSPRHICCSNQRIDIIFSVEVGPKRQWICVTIPGFWTIILRLGSGSEKKFPARTKNDCCAGL